jgi:paraquat-inducible protein B
MPETPAADALPQAAVVASKRGRISVVWLVPILAAVVALGIAVQRYLSEGPTIRIVFKAAEGIEAGKTFIKFKDVNIGQVTAVQLTDDFSKVEVTARIAKSAAGLIVEDARFWVVEPRITLNGVSGLGTLLSGNYIGFEAGKSNKAQRNFTGLEVAPIVTGDQPGKQFVLHAQRLGSLGIGAPVYYRSLVAGQVVAYQLAADGKSIDVRIFVHAPYDQFVKHGTRFWNASGLDVTVGANGVDVRTQSLVALIAGGLAFETPPFATNLDVAAADSGFTLYADQATAMKQSEDLAARYVLYFNETLRGLSVGAPVTLLGLPGGTVTDIGLDINPKTLKVRGRVEIIAYPERLVARLSSDTRAEGAAIAHDAAQRAALIRRMFEEGGLRAQLRSGSLITGQLFVGFDAYPKAPKVKIDWSKRPIELPTVLSTLPQFEEQLGSILAKLDKFPLDALGSDLRTAIASFDQLLKDTDKAIKRIDVEVTPEIRPALQAFKSASASATTLLNNTDATLLGPDAPALQELRSAMQEVTRAARSLRVLMDYLEQNPSALIRGKTEENR